MPLILYNFPSQQTSKNLIFTTEIFQLMCMHNFYTELFNINKEEM